MPRNLSARSVTAARNHEVTSAAQPSRPWRYALIFGVTLLAYFPALRAGFIWDDHPGHVTRPGLQSLAGLVRIWFEPGATQQYYPLLHTAFWLEHRCWGEAATGYHLVNILLHAMAACLALRLLERLAVRGATLAALLFALHPVCVESVAWVSEQKNTLSAVLYFCAALAYLRFEDTRQRSAHARATVLFALALLTKTVTATLPATLLVLGWWRRGRLEWRRDVLPLLPWFVLSLLAGAMTAWVEHAQIGAHGDDFGLSSLARVLLAGRVLWFYFGKLLWPANLSFIYPRWIVDVGDAAQWLPSLAALALLIAFWCLRNKTRAPLAVLLLFAGTLFPALGFINVFPFLYSYVADHFQYLASLAIFAVAAAAATRLPATAPRLAAVVVLAVLGALASRQAKIYHDVFTLYADTLAKNPGAWMAHNNLAIALVEAGRAAEALPHYERALALRPRYAEAENNFGFALTQLGRPADALVHLERALQLQPRYAEAQNNLGIALMALNRTADGLAAFARAVETKPDYARAHVNLGLALARNGRALEALPHFQRAAQLDSQSADAELNWGIALLVSNQVAASLPHFERAVELAPDSSEIRQAYSRALTAAGRFDEADHQTERARQLSAPR